jgi:hypothetical protein
MPTLRGLKCPHANVTGQQKRLATPATAKQHAMSCWTRQDDLCFKLTVSEFHSSASRGVA